ncbi:MAG: ribonuclease H-like domain-containing protein [Candidatus Lokiarchaeota archaeon]|nr:ribonuclease H-like domain-containing protein [Candidatus Lokiarchaeota archaeon]
MSTSSLKFEHNAVSSYYEYPPKSAWNTEWTSEILRVICYIHECVSENLKLGNEFCNKKIVCLDIETTDIISRAKEGYMNIMGLAVLDLRPQSQDYKKLTVFQAFNMLRKRDLAPELLNLSSQYIADCDVVIVFNQSFDIPIIKKISSDFNIPYNIPSTIIDIQDDFYSVRRLEQFMSTAGFILRELTEKGKYSEYYAKFKGDSKGKDKQIEPIGIYNLMDVLSVLFYALHFRK